MVNNNDYIPNETQKIIMDDLKAPMDSYTDGFYNVTIGQMADRLLNSIHGSPWDAAQGCIYCYRDFNTVAYSKPIQQKTSDEDTRPYKNVTGITCTQRHWSEIISIIIEIHTTLGVNTITLGLNDKVSIMYHTPGMATLCQVDGVINGFSLKRIDTRSNKNQYHITIYSTTTNEIVTVDSDFIRNVSIITRSEPSGTTHRLIFGGYKDEPFSHEERASTAVILTSCNESSPLYAQTHMLPVYNWESQTQLAVEIDTNIVDGIYELRVLSPKHNFDTRDVRYRDVAELLGTLYVNRADNIICFIENSGGVRKSVLRPMFKVIDFYKYGATVPPLQLSCEGLINVENAYVLTAKIKPIDSMIKSPYLTEDTESIPLTFTPKNSRITVWGYPLDRYTNFEIHYPLITNEKGEATGVYGWNAYASNLPTGNTVKITDSVKLTITRAAINGVKRIVRCTDWDSLIKIYPADLIHATLYTKKTIGSRDITTKEPCIINPDGTIALPDDSQLYDSILLIEGVHPIGRWARTVLMSAQQTEVSFDIIGHRAYHFRIGKLNAPIDGKIETLTNITLVVKCLNDDNDRLYAKTVYADANGNVDILAAPGEYELTYTDQNADRAFATKFQIYENGNSSITNVMLMSQVETPPAEINLGEQIRFLRTKFVIDATTGAIFKSDFNKDVSIGVLIYRTTNPSQRFAYITRPNETVILHKIGLQQELNGIPWNELKIRTTIIVNKGAAGKVTYPINEFDLCPNLVHNTDGDIGIYTVIPGKMVFIKNSGDPILSGKFVFGSVVEVEGDGGVSFISSKGAIYSSDANGCYVPVWDNGTISCLYYKDDDSTDEPYRTKIGVTQFIYNDNHDWTGNGILLDKKFYAKSISIDFATLKPAGEVETPPTEDFDITEAKPATNEDLTDMFKDLGLID